VSVETGWWVINTKSMADRAAPAVVQPRLVRLGLVFRASHQDWPCRVTWLASATCR
jgi:hypothetical protein